MIRPASRLLSVFAVIALLVAWLQPAGAGAAAQTWTLSPGDEAQYVANINSIRASNGLGPLTVDSNMTGAARNWTIWMAENTTLAHADDIVTGAPSDWLKVGENVGRGGSVNSVWEAFLASPGHAANVLDPEYDFVGIGVAWTEDGRLYTTHRFASTESAGSPAPPPPTPAPSPTPLPDPPPAVESESDPEPAVDQPDQPESPSQLPFSDPDPVGPPAQPERLAVTMALLLAAG